MKIISSEQDIGYGGGQGSAVFHVLYYSTIILLL